MKKNPEGEFLKLLDYWLNKFEIENVIIQRDNRGPGLASVEDDDFNDEHIFRYNWKALRHCRKHTKLSVILHEIGHILHGLPYNTERQEIKSEYYAERFALDTLKEHHPVHYRNEIKRMRRQLSRKKYRKNLNKVHLIAYQKIEEYIE